MSTAPDPRQNHILDALPKLERERLFPHLKLVPLPLGMVVYESGATLRHIYFPTNSIVSLLYVMQDGASAEIAVVATRGSSAYRCSWAERPHRAAPSCRARATPTA